MVWKIVRAASALRKLQRLSGRDDRRARGGAAAQQVALAVEEVGDRERIGGRRRAVGEPCARPRRPPASPPWLSFSGRCPCVSRPRRSTLPENGSTPPRAPGAKATGMIPIDSYHEARLES